MFERRFKAAIVACALVLVSVNGVADQSQANGNPEAAKLKNPVNTSYGKVVRGIDLGTYTRRLLVRPVWFRRLAIPW